MAFLGDIIKINEADYTALKNAGSSGYVINGVRYYYDENNIYLTVENPDKGKPDYSRSSTLTKITSGLPSGTKTNCQYYQAPNDGIVWPSIINTNNNTCNFHIYSTKSQSWLEFIGVHNGYGTQGGQQIWLNKGDFIGIAGNEWAYVDIREIYFIPIG